MPDWVSAETQRYRETQQICGNSKPLRFPEERGRGLLKDMGRSLLGRIASLAVFVLGFWVLYQALGFGNRLLLALGVAAGAALILGGLYLMATTRRIAARSAAERDYGSEDSSDDTGSGSGKSD